MATPASPGTHTDHAAHTDDAAHIDHAADTDHAAHIDHAADIRDVYVPASARAAVERLRADHEPHVWWWRLREAVDPADYALLDEVERGRARRFHAARDAAAFTATRAGARRAVAALLGLPAHNVRFGRRICPGCGDSEHGPPAVVRPPVPLAVSLSRTTGCGVLAVRAGDWVGVDVEAYRPLGSDALAETVLTAAERRQLGAVAPGAAREEVFHRAWTRKEAVVKAVGLGLLGMPLNALDVAPGEAGPLTVGHVHEGRTTRWRVEDIPLPGTWSASLARPAGAAPGEVRVHAPA
ncbi:MULTISPECIES: 4'-phosphopantetheinyl transferase family protein [Streptomyces]|uniref:4'-phosphopantetheinyl transferase superfamily protein n=1 Tax=Streptomyces evansiae TaxID=3075535 RepID=A0ABU2QTU8_9ACTN|nr:MULTISPECIES: 4'-phosphopantetheinyl transferase superfamily protein [unclassified Streptomyces]MDT0407859.1 4'-phosphopantetheinyl transferase superfamily protein [Streptomyces sp. DSM 41979]MYQ58449.1 4'-phosphopantetheinyl transferase superfamily protein [Streptomyces sp. SID4926]